MLRKFDLFVFYMSIDGWVAFCGEKELMKCSAIHPIDAKGSINLVLRYVRHALAEHLPFREGIRLICEYAPAYKDYFAGLRDKLNDAISCAVFSNSHHWNWVRREMTHHLFMSCAIPIRIGTLTVMTIGEERTIISVLSVSQSGDIQMYHYYHTYGGRCKVVIKIEEPLMFKPNNPRLIREVGGSVSATDCVMFGRFPF